MAKENEESVDWSAEYYYSRGWKRVLSRKIGGGTSNNKKKI